MWRNLEGMALFSQVADSGSFTAAAKVLGLPKSTVSQRVAELESVLGVRLLQRTTRKLSLTGAGQLYLSHCRTMLDAAEAAHAAVSRLREQPTGHLRITMPEVSGVTLFPDLVTAFRGRYPGIEIDVVVTDAHLDLVQERIDLAFRTGPLEDSSFVCRRLGDVRRVLVAAPGYLARHGEPETPGDLLQHACLVHHPARAWPLEAASGIVRVEPVPRVLSNSLLLLSALAERGEGIGMFPAYMVRAALQQGRLKTVMPASPVTRNAYYVIYPSRTHMSAALGAMLDFVADYGLADVLAARDC